MLSQIWIYTLVSVFLVSLISLIGIITLSLKTQKLNKILLYLIALSAGTLIGGAFLHLLPELAEDGFTLSISFYILSGILIFFVLEKVIHWNHCHTHLVDKKHIHPFAYTNLIGDALHNFLDGIIIAASYLISIPAGIATTLAVILHEIPQEVGDFGVLIQGGFTKSKALAMNFLSALTAFLGAILTLTLTSWVTNIELPLTAIAAGGFIYIALSDLIPEIHKHSHKISKSLLQLLVFLIGIGLMALLLLLE
ncbi:MAG: ZIP family metal transporter [Nanoarchaeota archaeon]|nr:ZIP family metal transporter [Nanoarchaeota archaeon]